MTAAAVPLNPEAGVVGPSLLAVSDLSVRLGADRSVRAVSGVSLEVHAAEVLAVVGESGCGKTALARAILGLHNPRQSTVRGSVRFDGDELTGMARARRRQIAGREISFVAQNPASALDPIRRVGNQIAEALQVHGILAKNAVPAKVLEILDRVGIPDPERVSRQYPHQLSGGMKQRVVIGIAIACEPRLIIADEPTTALDVTVQKRIIALLERMRAETGTAIVLISHNLALVSGFADRIAVMYAGRIVEVGPSDEIVAAPCHPYTKALLACLPSVNSAPDDGFPHIPGAPPTLDREIPGCAFAPRCSAVMDECSTIRPPVTSVADIQVACHLYHDDGGVDGVK